jgi:hypothetical protein
VSSLVLAGVGRGGGVSSAVMARYCGRLRCRATAGLRYRGRMRMKESTREMLVFLGVGLLVILIAAGPKILWLLRREGWLGAG